MRVAKPVYNPNAIKDNKVHNLVVELSNVNRILEYPYLRFKYANPHANNIHNKTTGPNNM